MAKGKRRQLTDAEKAKKDVERNAAFVRVVTPRINKALKAIRLVGSCAGPSYIYTREQRDAVGKALQVEVMSCIERFAGTKKEAASFVLPS